MATGKSANKVTFAGSMDQELRGDLHLPAGEPRAFAIVAHCFTCSKDSHAASRISAALTGAGFAVLRFDFTGLGASDGDFADTTFGSNIEDLEAAADWLTANYEAPQLLVGHSLGGAAAIAAGGRLESVQAVATIGAPSSPDHVMQVMDGDLDADAGSPEDMLEVNIGGRPFNIRRNFIADLNSQPHCERLGSLGKALLVMHSPTDQTVGVDEARIIFESARHPKSFVALDGADHLLSNRADSIFAASIIAAWADRYLGQEDPAAKSSQPESGDEEPATLTVAEMDVEGFLHQAQVRHHRWPIDEPISVGGDDAGPTPYEVLLSGLGACTSMTMRMYARRKGWEFGATTVTLEHARVHARDIEDCDSAKGMVDKITRTIAFAEGIPADQQKALLAIADKCPVHRTLEGEIVVVTKTAV